MIVKITNGTTGEVLTLNTRDLIAIDLEPETKEEEANDWWGSRQSVIGLIHTLKNVKLVDGR